jgi:hypothetical protein
LRYLRNRPQVGAIHELPLPCGYRIYTSRLDFVFAVALTPQPPLYRQGGFIQEKENAQTLVLSPKPP